MNLASLVVHTLPSDSEQIAGQLLGLPGVEIHANTDDGRLVVTVDNDTPQVTADTLQAIHETRGVISAAITFQYSDDSETDESET
ncbi:MAG: glutamate synthase [Gammaproteobacteria bacterium]|jgi:nitrate reductase NapD|nr:glutamate synthase [Gammaproteobacteria bacterium]